MYVYNAEEEYWKLGTAMLNMDAVAAWLFLYIPSYS